MSSPSKRVVAIAASSVQPGELERLVAALPADAPIAFVIVVAGSADEVQALARGLETKAALPVVATSGGVSLAAGRIYLWMGPGLPELREGRLVESSASSGTALDVLFRSIAAELGEAAIGVTLGGPALDGSAGLRAIRAGGGLAFSCSEQELPEEEQGQRGLDAQVPLSRLGPTLLRLAAEGPAESSPRSKDEVMSDEIRERIYDRLRRHVGHDFSGYKPSSFDRRVGRRLLIEGHDSLDEYVEGLDEHPARIHALGRDLLIGVTGFFRNPEAFAVLSETVIPGLLEGRGVDETVRLWVPACATGEEVYSLAMLLSEGCREQTPCPSFRIFATDIDDRALAYARAAIYPEASMADVPDDLRERYFEREAAGYRVAPELREKCIFASHNIISAPPLSRMDLVSCRNVLIYFGTELQERVFPILHYALRPEGILFLGTAESPTRHGDLFTPIDARQRVFQKRAIPRRRLRLPDAARTSSSRVSVEDSTTTARPTLQQLADRQILERHSPPHVVVDGMGKVVHFSGNTRTVLDVPRGSPSADLPTLTPAPLRSRMRELLLEVQELQGPVSRTASLTRGNGTRTSVTMRAEPLFRFDGEVDQPRYLVVFETSDELSGEVPTTESESPSRALEAELDEARERLQFTIEEYETALHELKVSNEELASVNEEAQSANEELEASTEEMRSLNEELTASNSELARRVEEARAATSDLRNLYASARIATVFLSQDLVIRDFTPEAASLLNLRSGDRGRPLTELASVANYPELAEHIRTVAATGEKRSHRLTSQSGEHYLVRLMAYLDSTGAREGVVVTFVDVTTLVQAEERLETLVAELNHRVKNMLSVVIALARSSAKPGQTLDDFVDDFCIRLGGLSSSYELLAREAWAPIDLRALAETELRPHGQGRISLTGDAHRLDPGAVVPLGMALHELATNSVKHGALSVSSGRVDVSWESGPEGLGLRWLEAGGPPVEPGGPVEGFGLSLLKGQVEYQLDGTLALSFEPTGLDARLRLPQKWSVP